MTESDLFAKLQKEKRAVLLYGMGNGADKIMEVLAAKNIPVAGVFASDGFVRGQFFHGMKVLSFCEVRERYAPGECVILLSFGTARPDVLETIEQVAATYELLVPDLPVCGGAVFDRAFAEKHAGHIRAARALFADEASQKLYDDIITFRLSGNLPLLLNAVSQKSAWTYLQSVPRPIRRIADFGAYTGDSAREAMTYFNTEFILTAEPDRRNFKKLTAWSEGVTHCTVECHQVAVCDRVGEATFDASGNRNARLGTGKTLTAVATATPDHLLNGRAVDYIKYDIEGAEQAALQGSVQTILAHRPALRIALYHHSADLFEIPLQLHAMCPRYRLYLTRERSVPAWDIDLLAIPC